MNSKLRTGNRSLERLEERYFKAVNALSEYRHKHGFQPGTKVIAKFREEPEKTGTIAPYGEAWRGVDKMCVPVLLDEGRLQSWYISDLTLQTQVALETS